ncbi:CGNR zinc finger domain-containing protein [Saxibacter everestensis]|uniref:CGNR zinc finger domain-containing protein n=1 Tax=Saxibacter everestensis TaxID=2909229 RepID=A0ABY8QUE6_9MICO|nr:CGNR zinc finger domain-containing protein [Brevibacteriaceae bacterium ZFBP1038]
MVFAYDTEAALLDAADLVNTAVDGEESLGTVAALSSFLDERQFTGKRERTRAELESVWNLRERLRTLWEVSESEAVAIVNQLLLDGHALPQLVKHDEWDWHLHATRPDAPLAQRIGTEAAMAFVDLIRGKELGRLRICDADRCSAVLIDLSKNRSRRYCDTGNCANRMHVAAYRARQAEKAE